MVSDPERRRLRELRRHARCPRRSSSTRTASCAPQHHRRRHERRARRRCITAAERAESVNRRMSAIARANEKKRCHLAWLVARPRGARRALHRHDRRRGARTNADRVERDRPRRSSARCAAARACSTRTRRRARRTSATRSPARSQPGQTDDEIRAYFNDRYGQDLLLAPRIDRHRAASCGSCPSSPSCSPSPASPSPSAAGDCLESGRDQRRGPAPRRRSDRSERSHADDWTAADARLDRRARRARGGARVPAALARRPRPRARRRRHRRGRLRHPARRLHDAGPSPCCGPSRPGKAAFAAAAAPQLGPHCAHRRAALRSWRCSPACWWRGPRAIACPATVPLGQHRPEQQRPRWPRLAACSQASRPEGRHPAATTRC